MSAPIELDDPDVRVHAAWLAQVSDAADGLVARQVPKQGSTSASAKRLRAYAAKTAGLLDHLMGEREQLVGNIQAERLGALEVDHKLELGRLLNRQVGWLSAFEDSSSEYPGLAIGVVEAYAITQ